MDKIAIATEGNYVSGHFGHCPEFTLFELEADSVIKKEKIANPGHKPGFLPPFLGGFGVTHIIAGGMGPMAQQLFVEQGIEPIIGVSGDVDEVIKAFIDGTLQRGESTCNHREGHECQGH